MENVYRSVAGDTFFGWLDPVADMRTFWGCALNGFNRGRTHQAALLIAADLSLDPYLRGVELLSSEPASFDGRPGFTLTCHLIDMRNEARDR